MNFANGIDDDELWAETEEAAQVLGFTDEQRIAMYKTCAGILHWGNGQFKQRPREEQAEVADSAGERPDPDFWGGGEEGGKGNEGRALSKMGCSFSPLFYP